MKKIRKQRKWTKESRDIVAMLANRYREYCRLTNDCVKKLGKEHNHTQYLNLVRIDRFEAYQQAKEMLK